MPALDPLRNFLDALAPRPLLCDGAMGTQLIARGMLLGACPERWNVDHPADVLAIHRAYRQAGCELIQTNTFGGTTLALRRHGLEARADEFNRQGVGLVRQAVDETAFVLGTIGPFGGFLNPLGSAAAEVFEAFVQQANSLASASVDAFIIETMTDPAELALAVRAARQSRLPVIASYTFKKTGSAFHTHIGTDLPTAIRQAITAGADVVGSNCGTNLTPADYLLLAEQIIAAADGTPIIIQPNAGPPLNPNSPSPTYAITPADLARLAIQLRDAGVRIIGGCCGTTPAHLAAIAHAIR